MKWNWQRESWPEFTWDHTQLVKLEENFLHQTGLFFGTLRHLDSTDKNTFVIEIISTEAVKTSEIEGEILNRDSVQSSLRRSFDLATDHRKVAPPEKGIADMMTSLHHHGTAPLTHQALHAWHQMIMADRRDIADIGCYRTHPDPMQIVSGAIYDPKVHFEAPASTQVPTEMAAFISWFNRTAPNGDNPLPPLTRAALSHLYFVSIHPYEDGNGRLARALSELALSQHLGQPVLLALSHTIEANKKAYYAALAANNQTLEVTAWLTYFGNVALSSLAWSQGLVDFIIAKTRLYDRLRGKLNPRQEKALARMFREGPDGFTGGLSAENYLAITGTSRATATRDLSELVAMGALTRTGNLKTTRYWLKLTEEE